jgi:hypothetical protein
VPQCALIVGLEEGGPVGQARSIDQPIDAPEPVEACPNQAARRARVRKVGGDEDRRRPGVREFFSNRLPPHLVSAGDQQASGAGTGERLGDCSADALRRSRHQNHLAVEFDFHRPSQNTVSIF